MHFNSFLKILRIGRSKKCDLAPIVELFNAGKDYEALIEKRLDALYFFNPPFSLSYIFKKKASIEFAKGRNVIILVPSSRTDPQFVKESLNAFHILRKSAV